jgi:hypothetical protein
MVNVNAKIDESIKLKVIKEGMLDIFVITAVNK